MKRFFQTIALVAAFMVMSAPAWSDTYTDHVSIANNGKGDLMIFPAYFAFEGFHTKLQVTNTRNDMSAIAKVVVRSPLWSQELLDFFIFLTPTDVWEGYLMWSGGQPVIYSEDDSSLTSTQPTFATPESPMQQPLVSVCDDAQIYGYVEVFLTHVFPNDVVIGGDNVNLTRAPVKKADLFEAYVGDGTVDAPDAAFGFVPRAADLLGWPTNILAGNMQIQSPLLGWSSALNAVTFKDYLIRQPQGLAETVIGDMANNNLHEVEAALARNDIGMPYIYGDEGNTFHFFNFPTKYTRLDLDECRTANWLSEYVGFVPTDFNAATGTWGAVRVRYETDLYDQKEIRRTGVSPIFSPAPVDANHFPYELDFFSPAVSGFEKGWVRYTLPNGPSEDFNLSGDPLRYFGAPVIPFVMNFGEGGFSMMNAFYSERQVQGISPVTGDWTNLPGYQYARFTPST
ncbi:hypothetical protein [Desulfonatronovibrio magnus]|uniref:hypothetical protein n=1 Tax=Desulfonatronovibrio magnus TaxID=698827 RepID=UPI0005EAFF2F|nr:hypothetical protein [Desulfonatronovibrio magnus]